MANEFEPYNNEGKKSEFSVWEFQSPEGEEKPIINPEEELINERERLKQEAIEQGYAEGIQQGQAEITALKSELIKWVDLLQKPVHLLDDQLIQELIQVIICLSQNCIGVELSINPDKLCGLINEIKGELPSLKGNKVFAMHPLDVEWIKAKLDEKEIPGFHSALVADPTLSRGDFYLKGDHSELDGRLQTRFATIFAKYMVKDNLIPPKQTQE